ncbi:MAG: Fic family protein [Candidatus Pacearchaeota archaeon]
MVRSGLLTCSRCDHSWIPRKEVLPKNCPSCNNPNWNGPSYSVSESKIRELKNLIKSTHDDIIDLTGGLRGIRDEGGLYFSSRFLLEHMNSNFGDPIEIGTSVFNEFSRKHHFNDGNKRTSFVVDIV